MSISKYLVNNAKEKYSFEDLVEIIKILRSPEGCPWDREQTHESIRKNFIEETYEVIEAIDNGDKQLLKEELGDVLLQVLFHSSMESEQGVFDIYDVITGICKKLILRHPHVFGDVEAKDSKQVLTNWDNIKKTEKNQKSDSEVLKSIPRNLPALMRAVKIQAKAAKTGFDWDNYKDAFKKIDEEKNELIKAINNNDKNNIEEEIGDLLFSVVNVCRFFDIEPEEALTKTNDKFVKRFTQLEKLAEEKGKKLNEMTLDEMDELWDFVKDCNS